MLKRIAKIIVAAIGILALLILILFLVVGLPTYLLQLIFTQKTTILIIASFVLLTGICTLISAAKDFVDEFWS